LGVTVWWLHVATVYSIMVETYGKVVKNTGDQEDRDKKSVEVYSGL
jgi:hypothetical protein